MTVKSPRDILHAIRAALRENEALLAAGEHEVIGGMLSPPLDPPPSIQPDLPVGPKPESAREILDAIDRALRETRRRLAELEIDGNQQSTRWELTYPGREGGGSPTLRVVTFSRRRLTPLVVAP